MIILTMWKDYYPFGPAFRVLIALETFLHWMMLLLSLHHDSDVQHVSWLRPAMYQSIWCILGGLHQLALRHAVQDMQDKCMVIQC